MKPVTAVTHMINVLLRAESMKNIRVLRIKTASSADLESAFLQGIVQGCSGHS